MYKAVIFDFFDVVRTDAFKAWLNLHHYKLEGPLLDAVKQQDHGLIEPKEFLNLLSEITGQPADDIFEEMERGASVDREVVALAEQLHATYKIGLLSNSPSGFLRGLLQTHGLESYFDEIVISSEVGLIKPDPAIFQHMLERLQVAPNEAVFIDDNPANVAGAEAVGITGITYTDVTSLREALTRLGLM